MAYRNNPENREYGEEAPRLSPKLAGAERLGVLINASFMGYAVAVKLESLTMQAGRKEVAVRRRQKPILRVISV